MVEAACRAFGKLDILVCNAGISPGSTLHKVSLADFRYVVDVNFYGTLYPIHAALPAMRDVEPKRRARHYCQIESSSHLVVVAETACEPHSV